MPWANFHIWRGRLPHWRADDVVYYATFRHRRALDDDERHELMRRLAASDGRDLDVLAIGVQTEQTELLFRARPGKDGRPVELSGPIERAKAKAGKAILKRTGERWPPFYAESFDRIVRDDAEFQERWESIVAAGLDDRGVWVAADAAP